MNDDFPTLVGFGGDQQQNHSVVANLILF